jgi:hypothetical protein
MASIEPIGMFKLVKGIRDIEKALGKKEERKLFPGEILKLETLRGK